MEVRLVIKIPFGAKRQLFTETMKVGDAFEVRMASEVENEGDVIVRIEVEEIVIGQVIKVPMSGDEAGQILAEVGRLFHEGYTLPLILGALKAL